MTCILFFCGQNLIGNLIKLCPQGLKALISPAIQVNYCTMFCFYNNSISFHSYDSTARHYLSLKDYLRLWNLLVSLLDHFLCHGKQFVLIFIKLSTFGCFAEETLGCKICFLLSEIYLTLYKVTITPLIKHSH